MHKDMFVAITPDGVAFDSVAHRRLDLDPDEIVVTSTERAGRTLITITTDLEDPGLAMLADNTWCHVSRELADGTLHHVGMGWIDPLSIQRQDEDLVSLDVICSPRDWETAVAAALVPYKSLPGFDPVLVPLEKRDDPVEILDGYSKLVMCHPSTHEMTVVDILGVDLPQVEIADSDYPGPQPDAATRMVQRVDVSVTTEWVESRSGQIDAGNTIEGEFEEERASTLTPDAFEAKWPKEGSTINGDSGYTVLRSVLTRRDDLHPDDFPRTAGPAHGSSGVYNYVVDPDLLAPEPQEIMLDRTWYDLELVIGYKVAQRRRQVVRFSIVNGAPAAAGGSVQVLDLKTEDITVDDTTPPWEPDTDYAVNDVVRVGSRNWRCQRAHHSLANFGADMWYSLGGGLGYGQQWTPLATDESPLGTSNAITYFHTVRGRSTLQAVALKARAIIAASIRNRTFSFDAELTDDLLELTTGHVVKVACDGQPDGWLIAKVVEVEISSNADDEGISITVAPAAGSGTVFAGAALSQTGEDWDRLFLGSIDGQEPVPLPDVGGTVSVANQVDEQLEHLAENDYSPADGRDDEKENDPLELLKAVPTTLVLSLTQLSGRDVIVQEIDLPVAHPWSGPKQYGG